MPIHGSVPHLDESIASVINQELTSWELIIALDRPTAQLVERVDRIIDKDNRIKKIISPGSGIVDALNFGLNFANAELVARLDSDDIMEPDRLSIQASYFSGSPKLVCVGSQMTFIDDTGNFTGTTSYPINSVDIQKYLRYQNCIGHPSVMYRKKIVMEVGSYRAALTGVEDYDLWLRLSRNFQIENLDQALTRYRISPGQYSKTFGDKHTILEEAARLDSIINFIDDIPKDHQTIDFLESEISRIRKKYIFLNPLKIISSYQGYFVSRIIRIIGSKESKFLKFLKCIPYTAGLIFINPNPILKLIKKKLKRRNY
jgi:glycosyltransferase involved in cell wall biosynthesis